MQNIKIEIMTKDDVDSVYQLEELIHPEHHWSKDSFYNELNNNLASYYCVKNDGEIIAYVGIWRIFEEAHITNIAVHPDFRKQGLASVLMIQIIKKCYKEMIKYITLEVRESNNAAIGLYEKFLFESIGMRKNYYQDNGENALIMFTQNIFYDRFKKNFNEICDKINQKGAVYAE